jgi:hypothetical protein
MEPVTAPWGKTLFRVRQTVAKSDVGISFVQQEWKVAKPVRMIVDRVAENQGAVIPSVRSGKTVLHALRIVDLAPTKITAEMPPVLAKKLAHPVLRTAGTVRHRHLFAGMEHVMGTKHADPVPRTVGHATHTAEMELVTGIVGKIVSCVPTIVGHVRHHPIVPT